MKSFFISALASTALVVAYGALVLTSDTDAKTAIAQSSYYNEFILIHADERKALFKTDDGLSMVMVGSVLSSAGQVLSIEKRDGRWNVTTNKQLTFVQR